MDEEDELERIIEDFDFDSEEAVGSAAVEEDASETQAQRLERLHQEGELTTAEYELLMSGETDDSSSDAAPQEPPSKSSDNDSWAKEIQFDIAQELRNIIPEDKFNNGMMDVSIEDRSTEDSSIMSISYSPDRGGFSYHCLLHERGHEERLFELLDGNTWEVTSDHSDDSSLPMVRIRRTAGQDGFQSDLPEGYVENEVAHLVDLIQTVYQTDLSDLRLD